MVPAYGRAADFTRWCSVKTVVASITCRTTVSERGTKFITAVCVILISCGESLKINNL
jgi:hypothetical protein